MTAWATNVAAANPKHLFVMEFEGETKHAFESTTGASAQGDATNLTTNTSNTKQGSACVSFDKGTTVIYAGVRQTVTAYDRDIDGAYDRIAVYLSDLSDVARIDVRLGTDVSNCHLWQISVSNLTAGWSRPYLYENTTESGVSYFLVGSPTDTATTFCEVNVVFNNTTDTLAGILVDWLTQHPRRYSTSRVTNPVAPTQQGVMRFPTIQPNTYDIHEGRIDVGAATVPVVDPEDAAPVITDLAQFRYIGRGAYLKMGFRGEAESDTTYKIIYRGFTNSIPVSGREWSFGLADVLDRLQIPFMTAATDASPVTLSTGVNIVTHFLQLALSTGTGAQGTYDTLTSGYGAGIPLDYFDIDAIEQERDDWLPLDTGGGAVFTQHEDNFLEWAFWEIFRPYGIIPVVTLEGKFSIRVSRPAYGAETFTTLTDENIIRSQEAQFSLARHNYANRVTHLYDHDVVDDEFDAESVVEVDGVSNNCHCGINVPVPLTIESKMLRSASVAARCGSRLLTRLSNAFPVSTVEVLPSLMETEIGDVVTLTTGRVPDLTDGDYSISGRLAEVFGRGYNPAAHVMMVSTSIVGFEQNNYRLIGPTSLTADYDSATSEQRANYCFIADGSDQLGAANDPAHVIGPG